MRRDGEFILWGDVVRAVCCALCEFVRRFVPIDAYVPWCPSDSEAASSRCELVGGVAECVDRPLSACVSISVAAYNGRLVVDSD